MAIALITGASSGLGVEFAWQLAGSGHDLVIVARDKARLENLAYQIRGVTGVNVEVLPADLADQTQLQLVQDRLAQTQNPVSLLVNNAGYTVPGSLLKTDADAEAQTIDVLAKAVLKLTKSALRQMLPRNRGAILNVASVAAHTTSGTYSANKAWVLTFTESLAAELKKQGSKVSATALCPGLVRTEFHERAKLDYAHIHSVAWIGIEKVVAQALRDTRQKRTISTPTLRYKLVSLGLRHAPRGLVAWLQSKVR